VSSRTEERKNDLRNTTVMEVIIAVTLILMLVIYVKDVTHLDQKKLDKDEITKLVNEINLLKKKVDELAKKNRNLDRENKDNKAKIKRLIENIEPGASGITNLNEFLKDREADLKKRIADRDEIIFNLKKKIKSSNMDTLIIAQLRAEAAKLKSKIQANVDKLGKFNKKGKGKNKGGGKGAPRCLVSGNEIKWLADIRKKGKLFKFELVETGFVRNQLIKEVPGIKYLVDRGLLTKEKFKRGGNQIYKWGLKQKISCRFYVLIHKENMSLDDVLFMEKFFYKNVVK
jgi:hypothetical protein